MISQRHLATVYRPQRFKEVVGQEVVCKILSKAASCGEIASGYIFSGIRGVGKTTVARIFAKTINCEKAPVDEPCNECKICRQITKGVCVDVLEIDGASHTGVDNIRRLNEDISHRPVECKYKVIIIDEAHMLSKSAFNALLKTLEEPPGYVTFIFATTEPHRFPSTIISRCQHFVFKRIPRKQVVEHLKTILNKENIKYEEKAIDLIAQRGEGSLRDSLSMLSQVVSVVSYVSEEAVKEILGIADREKIYNIISAIKTRDIKGLMEEIDELMESGVDISFFLQEFSSVWRDLFIFKTSKTKDLSEVLGISEEDSKRLEELSFGLSLQQIHSAWQMTLAQQKNILSSPDPALSLQLMFLNIAYFTDLIPVKKLNHFFKEESSSQQRSEQKALEKKDWNGFLKFLRKIGKDKEFPNLKLIKPEVRKDIVILKCPGFMADRLLEEKKYERLKELVKKYFGEKTELSIVKQNFNNSVQTKERLKDEFLESPAIKRVINRFNAKLVDVYYKDNGLGKE